ncbi:MAG: ABC transporter permease [Alphaproteobacteria bacterium]|nr:ABC transporter permease [Alphaproteobacteria bacterium]
MSARILLLLHLGWRNLWRNPRRTVITILVVSVGVWSILTLSVVLNALAASSRDTTLKLMMGDGQIHARGYRDDPTAAHDMPIPEGRLRRTLKGADIQAYAERVRVTAIVQSEYRTLPVTLVGVLPVQEARISVIPHEIASGKYLSGPDDPGLVLGRNLARRLKTRVGKRVVIMTEDRNGHLVERAFTVVGLFAATVRAEDQFIFTGLHTAQAFTGLGNALSEISFAATRSSELSKLLIRLKQSAPKLDIKSWKELAPLPFAVSAYVDLILNIWLGIAVSVVTLGIVNTQLMAVLERTHEFGLVQALGMRPRLVLWEVTLETVWLNCLGVAVGVVAAIATVHAFPNGLYLGFLSKGAEVFGGDSRLHLAVNSVQFVRYGLIVWSLGTVATLIPARRASRVSPIEAMNRT